MVEFGEVRFTLNHPLGLPQARWLRGAIMHVVDRVEFHNHLEQRLVYQHPLVRYDTSTGNASVLWSRKGRAARSQPSSH